MHRVTSSNSNDNSVCCPSAPSESQLAMSGRPWVAPLYVPSTSHPPCLRLSASPANHVLQVIALYNGGPPGVIYAFIAVSCFYFMIAACIAEMASAIPSSSGVYHWASVTAGAKYGKVVGFFAGWYVHLQLLAEPVSAPTTLERRAER
jgi:hypothetical protein